MKQIFKLLFVVLLCVSFSNCNLNETKTSDLVNDGNGVRRIFGGRKSEHLPFFVSLELSGPEGKQKCGGSLIGLTVVVTGAHCVENAKGYKYRPKDIKVFYGSNIAINQKSVAVKGAVIHGGFDRSESLLNDIAVLFLERPLTEADNVLPVDLAKVPSVDTPVWAAGFGRLSLDKPAVYPEQLMKGQMFIISKDDCEAKSHNRYRVSASEVCTIGATSDTCLGDSGGPLYTVENSGKTDLIGITSWGQSCDSGAVSVYTRIYEYLFWLFYVVSNKEKFYGDYLVSSD